MVSPVAPRLAWLDALRGMAALTVAMHHVTYYYAPHLRSQVGLTLPNPGTYGVLVFFLISGYIVPASLERHGRVRDFWIGRFFRIYPVLLLACVPLVLPFGLGIEGLRGDLEQRDPLIAVLAHVTMLQDVLDVPNVINVLWTLSYEMVFYLLIVAVFVSGIHRHSASIAAFLAVGAIFVGAALPTTLLSRTAGIGPIVVFTVVLLAVSIFAASSNRAPLRAAGAILGGVLAIVLVTVNGRVIPWEGLGILTVMLTGTVIHRAERGRIGKRSAVLSIIVTLSACILIFGPVDSTLAALTFGGAMTLRHRRMPRPLVGLGLISYPVYLLHPVLLMIHDQIFGTPERDEVLMVVVFTGVLLAASWTTHHCVEAPMQRLGRRVARRLCSDAHVREGGVR